jgi:hypothetical protein
MYINIIVTAIKTCSHAEAKNPLIEEELAV